MPHLLSQQPFVYSSNLLSLRDAMGANCDWSEIVDNAEHAFHLPQCALHFS